MPTIASDQVRLLVAEDERLVSRLFSALLQRAGYQVDVVEGGEEAVSKWETGAYDLILMDLELPGMTGIEAAVAIRTKEVTTGSYTPIIAVTAWTLDDEERLCDASGFDHYLTKPIDIKNTLLLIEEILCNNEQKRLESCC